MLATRFSGLCDPAMHQRGSSSSTGVWEPRGGGITGPRSPTGDVVAEVPDADVAHPPPARSMPPRAALPGWRATPARKRSEILRRWFTLMTEHAEQLALLISLENGKSLPDARGEVGYAAEFFRWLCRGGRSGFRASFARPPRASHNTLVSIMKNPRNRASTCLNNPLRTCPSTAEKDTTG